MDYKNVIGESITRYDGVHGVITKIENGAIFLQYDDDLFSGGYLFDPFLREDAFFDNEELQKEIDDEINLIKQTELELIKKSIAKSIEDEKYYITQTNDDGSITKIYSLDCNKESAYRVFSHAIHEQQREYRLLNNKWKVLRMFETQTGKMIAQES